MPCENKKFLGSEDRCGKLEATLYLSHKKEEERDATRVLVSLLCKGEVVYMYIWFINLLKPTFDSPPCVLSVDIFYVFFISLSSSFSSVLLSGLVEKQQQQPLSVWVVWPKNREKKSKSSLFRAIFDETGDTKKLSSVVVVVRGNLFFPISVIIVSFCVSFAKKTKTKTKTKRSARRLLSECTFFYVSSLSSVRSSSEAEKRFK